MATHIPFIRRVGGITLTVAALSLAACHSTPRKGPEVGEARAALTELQNNPQLANHATAAIKDAEKAVQAAEGKAKNRKMADHLSYVAITKVRAAQAQAQAGLAEDKLKELSSQRDQAQLAARTREADTARQQATEARQQAAAASQQATLASQQASMAQQRSQSLEQQLASMNQRKTERGTVFTLGEALFATGKANLQPGAQSKLDRLAEALNREPERHVTIEGHTDSKGSSAANQALSQRRADAVRTYLVGHGVAAERVSAVGKGEDFPVASNNNAAGRQQNRRVEVIIENAQSSGTAPAAAPGSSGYQPQR